MKQILICFWAVFLFSCEKNSRLTAEKDPEKPVYHRQEAFKKILNVFEPMGLMLRKETPFSMENFKQKSAELKKIAGSPWQHFKPETNYPPSRSLNAIWEKKEAFQKAIFLFESAVQELNESALEENVLEIEKAYNQVHRSCRSCHQQFRR